MFQIESESIEYYGLMIFLILRGMLTPSEYRAFMRAAERATAEEQVEEEEDDEEENEVGEPEVGKVGGSNNCNGIDIKVLELEMKPRKLSGTTTAIKCESFG